MAKQAPKKQNAGKGLIKEMGSELKKVSFPTIGTTVKNTGVVLAVVIFFTLALFGIDRLLSFLYELLVSGIN